MRTDLRDKRGNMTAYAYACRYTDVYRHTNGTTTDIRVTLWREHGVYHVRAHNHATHTRLVWGSFHALSDARREFRILRRQIRTGVVY